MPEARIPLSMAVIDLALSPKSRSAESAIDAAAQAARAKACQMPDYLKYTPTALHEEDRYDYGMSAIWPYIQYLPDELKDARFYSPGNQGKYEKALAENLRKLNAHPRTSALRQLKQRFRKQKD